MVVIVMGVTGAGKTTVGSMLAADMNWEFADADNFHSPENKAKMHQGIPLTDADRAPWLAALHDAIAQWTREKHNAVLACSALKKCYREELRVGPEVKIVYLKGSPELIGARLQSRQGHFAGESILLSQFAALEEPQDAIEVNIDSSPGELVRLIRKRLAM